MTVTQPPDDRHDSDAAPGQIFIDTGHDEPIEVVNFRRTLEAPSSARDRTSLAKSLTAGPLRDDDAAHALARAVVNPAGAAAMVRDRLCLPETLNTTELLQLPAQLFHSELFVLGNPRNGGEVQTVPAPRVRDVRDGDGTSLAAVEMEFESLEHLAAYLRETVINTRRAGNDYSSSILNRRVSRPVVGHAVRVTFADGTPSFTVVAVRDGVTRVVSMTAAAMGGAPSPEQIADQMVDDLLASRRPRANVAADENRDRARGRDDVAANRRAAFTAGMAAGAPSEAAVRIGQTFTAPAYLYIGVRDTRTDRTTGGSPDEAGEVFADAVRAAVGAIHTEFKAWDSAAQNTELMERALQAAVSQQLLPRAIADLAVGYMPVGQTPVVFHDSAIPATALWRAIELTASLSGPHFAAIKGTLKPVAGIRQMRNKRFMSFLGPLIDLPWRQVKARSLQSARRAWSGGGPLPATLLGVAWTPIPTGDFTELIAPALGGNADALATLQVGGGIALIADRLLSSNVGSAVTSGEVPYRSDPDDIIVKLGTSEAGLYQLARAANAFRADQPAINSFSRRDFRGDVVTAGNSYLVPAVDPDEPSALRRDGSGTPLGLTQYHLFRIANPDLTAAAEAAHDKRGRESAPRAPSPTERVAALRTTLLTTLVAANAELTELLTLTGPTGSAGGHPFTDADQWGQLRDLSGNVMSQVLVHPPTIDTPHGDTDTDTDTDEHVDVTGGQS